MHEAQNAFVRTFGRDLTTINCNTNRSFKDEVHIEAREARTGSFFNILIRVFSH